MQVTPGEGNNRIRMVMGSVKVTELVEEGVEETIVAASAYDSKPVHFLSYSCTEIKWIKKNKKSWLQEKESVAEL